MVSECKRPFLDFRSGPLLLLALLLGGCGSHVYHQVRPGDTLYSISWHYKQDYQQVARWNELSPPYTIHEGEWLRVAPPGSATDRAPPSRIAKNTSKNAEKQAGVTPDQGRRDTQVARAAPSPPLKDWIWPVKGEVTRKFTGGKPGKQGIDIAGSAGTPVRAAAGGRVVYSGNGLRGYGNLVIIKHNDKFLSAYAHNQSILVAEGAQVNQGDEIARMGNTESSTVKLHFQIRINGQPVDPLRYLP